MEGAKAIAAVLKDTQLVHLECAIPHRHTPVNMSGPTSDMCMCRPSAARARGSLNGNFMGAEGAEAIAAVLKDTKLVQLEYVVSLQPQCPPRASMPAPDEHFSPGRSQPR